MHLDPPEVPLTPRMKCLHFWLHGANLRTPPEAPLALFLLVLHTFIPPLRAEG